MNGPFRVAQANTGSQPATKPPTRIVKLAKPYSEQSVTIPLSYDGTVKADFSAIANEKITLVHVGEKLIILFDNKSTLTLEPFFDSSGKPLGNITVEVSPGRDLTGAEFAALFPVTEDQSVLPAAGPGTGNAQSSGANFTSVGVDPFSTPNPLDLLGQEELPNFTIENLLTQVFINDVPTISANDALTLDEDGLPNGNLAGIADFDPTTNGPVTLTGTLAFSYGADLAGSVLLLGTGAPDGFTYTLEGGGTVLTVSQLQDGVSVNVLQITLGDTTSGNYTITQLNPIRHAVGGDENDQQFTFTYRVTDSNGDFVDGTLSLTVDDDTPQIDVEVVEGEGESAGLFLNSLDESIGNDPNNTGIFGTLDDVGPGPDLTGTTPFGRIESFAFPGEGQSPGFNQLAGLFNIIKSPGSDGELITTQAFSLTLTGGVGGPPVATNLSATALAGTPLAGLDDSERAIVLVQVNATTVEARVVGDAAVSGDEFVVLRITLLNANDPANVQLRVEQFLPIDHGADGNDFDSSLPLLISEVGASLGLTLTATIIDNDGDPATSSETIVFVGNGPGSAINIEDDGPVLNDEGEGEGQPPSQSIALALDETIGEDRYNTGESESDGDAPNGTPDDTTATTVAAPSTAPAAGDAIGRITTAAGAIGGNFPALSADFGTDGPGPNDGFSQELSFVLDGDGTTGLIATALRDTSLAGLDAAERTIVLVKVSDTVIEGRIAGDAAVEGDEFVAFRITLNNPDNPATATITVEQFLPIDHGSDDLSVFDESIPLLLNGEGTLALQLVTTVADGDTDTIVQTDAINLIGNEESFITFDDDGPKVAVEANASFSIQHDETLLAQQPDDVSSILVALQLAALFSTVANPGDDQDVPLSLPLGFARSDNPALTVVNVDFGSDGGALSGSQTYSLTLTDLAGLPTTGPILSGLQTTELRDIYLFVEGDFIVGRYDPGVGLPDASDPAAFALAINPATGIVSVVQYVSLYHPDGTDRDDTVFLDDIAGSLNATLTVTDGDGDTASASVSIGAKVSFDDDGPSVAAIRNGNFRLTVDETPGVDSGTDDVAGPLTIFDGITQKGDDPDVSGTDPLAFATEANNPLVFVPFFGVDGPATSDPLVYSLDLNEPVDGAGVLTNLRATDGSPIKLFAETDGTTEWIVGRVDNPASLLDGDAAFAIHIDPVNGTVSLVQYLSLQHPNDSDPNDAVTLASGLIDAVVTLTDGDGDTASSEVNISNRIVFRDDGPTLVPRASTTAIVDEDGLHNPGTSTLSDANIDDPEIDGEVDGTNSNVFNGVEGDLSALVNFGADGFGSFGLKTVATPQPAGVKSQDKDVLIVSDGTILRGYVENGVGAPGFNNGVDRLVFTLTVNPDGSYTFTLLDQIDHPSLDDLLGDDTENLLDVAAIDLSSFIAAEDGDGDSVTLGAGSFTVQVLDDIPVLTARPAEQTQTTVTETLSFDLKGGNDIVAGISSNSIKGILATGEDLADDDDTANTSNNSIGIGDGQSIDGRETKGNKTTGPEVLLLEFFENVDVSTGNHGASYDVNRFRFSVDAAEAQGNDDAVVFVSVLNNNAVVSPANYVITINGGTPAAAGVIVHDVFDGATLVGFVFENVPDDADFQISAITGFVFDAVEVGNYNGFQFTSDGNAPKTVSTGNSFKVYGLEADIDTTIVTLETFKVSHDESPGVNVDPDPNAANDVDPNVTTPPDAIAGATIGYARSPGSVLAPGSLFAGKVGADEDGTYSFTITDSEGEPIDDVDSGLKTLDGTTILLSTDETGAVVGTAGATVIFKVYVDADGFVWIAQFAPIAHDLDGSGTAALDDIARVTAELYITGSLTDFDGDTVTATSPVALRVEFQDDGPVAVDDTDFVTEDGPLSADGNVRTGVGGSDTNDQDGVADALGTDGFDSIVWSGEQAGTIAGTYGALTVGTDGSYTYTLYTQQQNPTAFAAVQGLTNGETLSEEFGYQIIDGDGDSDIATLTITINGNDDGVTISDIAAVGGDTVVDEKGLPASSGSEGTGEAAIAGPNTDQSETNTGTFSFSTPDGFGALVIEGQTIMLAQLQNSAGSPVTVTGGTSLGVLTIIGFAGTAAGGTVTYRFSLLDNTTAHTDTDDNVSDGDSNRGADDQAFVSYSIQVLDEDATPDSATATLTIAINDDAPLAFDEQPQIVGEGVTLPGTFDFIAGADGATVTHLNGNLLSFNGDGWTNWIDLGLGEIRVRADGGYEFRADNPTLSPVAPITGTFTVTDGDNDTDTKAFAFQITDVNTPTAGNAVAAVDDDGLTGGNAASMTGDLDANLGDDVADTSERTFTGVLGGTVGGDGAGANGFTFAAALNGATATVGLETVTYSVVGGLLTATITTTADPSRLNTDLFTVEITNQATGAFKVTLLDNVLHDGGPNDEAIDATVNLGYVITDADGSPVPGNVLTVTFDDDAPTATTEASQDVAEGTTLTGGQFDFVAGADGATVTHINGNLLSFNGDGWTNWIDLGVGDIRVRADGGYEFRTDAASVNPATITGTFTVTDGDLDTDTKGFTFVVTDANTPVAGSAVAAVDDDGLIGGNAASMTGDLDANLGDDPLDISERTFTGVLGGTVGGDGAGANGFTFAATLNGATETVGLEEVTYSVAGGLLTATITTTTDLSRLNTTLFTVEITNQATGAFKVTLADNVLHAGGPNDEAIDATVNLGYVITDADGSAVPGSVLTVTFDDDAPSATAATAVSVNEGLLPSDRNPSGIAQSDTGFLNINWGADNGADKRLAFAKDTQGNPVGPTLTSDGVSLQYAIRFPGDTPGNEQIVAYKTGGDPDNDADVVFRVTLYESGSGFYTYVQYQNIDHDDAGTDVNTFGFTIHAFDTDGDSVSQTLTINVTDDVPEADDDSVTQAAADENQAVTVNVFANDVAGADGVDLDNNPDVAVTGSLVTGLGSLVYNDNGTFTYTPAPGETGNVTFNYTIEDGDGDTSTALVTITLAADSAPSVQTTNVTVDEDGLSSIANVDNAPLLGTETDSTESATQSGTIVVTFGKDVPAPANLLAAIQLSTLGLNVQLDALGGDVTWALSNSNRTLTGSVGFTPMMTIEITAANVTNAGTGEVTYDYTATLLQPVTHPGNPNEDFVTLDNVFFSVVDSDNSVQAGSFDVTIYDDVPEAVDNSVTQAAANENQAVTVNVFANDVAGADGIDLDNDPEVFVTGSLVTGLGSLVYNNNGTFTYTPASGETGNVTFNYTIRDGDDDPSTALVTITLAADSTPQIVTTTNLTVDEDGLSGIANVDNGLGTETDSTESATQSGTIVVTYGNDVPADLLAAIQLSNTGLNTQLDALGGDVTWVLSNSNRTLTGSVGATPVMTIAITAANVTNAGTGEVTYDYTATLLQPVTHPSNPNEDFVTLSNVGFTVTDSDNDPQAGSFDVTVYDDVPEAVADADTLDASAFTSASGNVVSGAGTTGGAASADTVGADGGGIVSGIVSDFTGGSTSVPPGVSGATIAGQYGDLTIHQDGSYTYNATSTAVPSSASDVFTYTLKDADGDTSTAKLTINFPAVDAPTITLGTGDATLEDTAVTAQFTATPDTNPASTITQIVVSGLTGWTQGTISLSNGTVGSSTFAAGVLTINVSGATAGTAVVASVVLTPPANSDVDASLSMTATSTTGVVVTTSAAATDTLYVDAVADPVTVNVSVTDSTSDGDSSFSANETGTLNAVATFGDNGDGSETHTVTIQLQSGFTAKVDGGTTLPSSGTSWVYLGVTYNYAFTYVAASGLLTVTVPNSDASATINIGVQAPGTLPATLTFDATATATETVISGGGTGAGNVDLAGNNTATATDTTGVPVTRQLNAFIETNTNVDVQELILTFIDRENPLDAYAQTLIRTGTGGEEAIVSDAGFNIDSGQFLVGLEAAIPGSKVIVRQFAIEGVDINPDNQQLDYDGSSNKDAAITAVISPSGPLTVTGTPSTDGGTENDNSPGGNPNDDPVADPSDTVFNYLAGQEGNDTVNGSTGSDIHSGGLGTDTVNAGTGNDVIVYSPGDTMNGGGGFDILRIDQGAVFNTVSQGGALGTGNSTPLSISSAEVTLSGTLSNIDSILLTQESTPDTALGTELNLSITDVLNMTDADNELSIDYSTDAFTGTDKTLFVIGSQGDKLDIDTAAWTLQAGTYSSPGGQIFDQYAALSGGNVLHLYVDQNIQVI